METSEQIKKFAEFIELYYKLELLENIRLGKNSIRIDFKNLSEFDIELTEILLEDPENTIKAFELAISNVDNLTHNFRVRIFNIPKSQRILIRNIRSKNINKFMSIVGTVRQKSEVRPQVTSAKFDCPNCGNIISVLQLDKKFVEPTRCACGRKGKFKLVEKELVDAQGITLEESTLDLLGGEQPKRMQILLKEDLVSPISDKKTNPGSRIEILGILKEVPILAKDGGKLTRFDLVIEANNIEPMEEDFSEIKITPKEEEEIIALSKNHDIHNLLIGSIAPGIYGHDKVKEAIILQLLGGVQKIRKDGVKTRGDFHILLIGDPGAGKSQLLKRVQHVAPKARYVSGKGASGAGLTAAVVKDEFLSGWSLEAGALVLANKGVCIIDELDKMSNEDKSAMHEALEQQTITISKANIQATLISETTVLAAANPKLGRFEPYETLAKQIDLPPALISRFDLIFPIRDLPNAVKDAELASFVLGIHQDKDTKEAEISTPILRKYLTYAKQNIHPVLNDDAFTEIKNYYVKMRGSAIQEGQVKSIPITARQLEALVRLAEASAKLRLSRVVEMQDAKKSIELLQYCLAQFGLDPETGNIDIDRISTGITASQRNKIHAIKEIINSLEQKLGKNIPIQDIIKEAQDKGITESQIDEAIEKLKKTGDIFEPKRGMISKL